MDQGNLGKQFHFDNEFWDAPLACGFIDLYQLGEICCEHGYQVTPHEQYVHEVTYIISGSGVSTVDDVMLPLREGDVLMCSQGRQHAVKAAERDLLRFAYIGFRFNDSANAEAYRGLRECYERPYVLTRDQNDIMFPFFRAIAELYSKTAFWQQMLQCYCEQIVIQAVRGALDEHQAWRETKRMNRSISAEAYRIIQYIGENVENIGSVKEIAVKLGYNYTYLSHFFTRATGTTLQKYISQKKIERARQMLKYEGYSATETAERLHYESVQSFSKAFRRVVGVPPTVYLQMEHQREEARLREEASHKKEEGLE